MSLESQSLGRRMAKGAGWMVLQRLGVRGIGIVSTIILARLLVPEDFGLVALATMFVAALTVMSEFGFDIVLIQNQSADRRHYDTAWTLSIGRNAVVALLLVLLAMPISVYFDEARLEAILYWVAVAAFAGGFQNIGVVNFRKHLRFHKEFSFMVAAKLGAFAVTVVLAILWRSYWALVAGIVAGTVVRVGFSYAMEPYRPRLSLAKWREIMGFSKWLLFNNILWFLFNRSDTFIIGKIVGVQPLGLYSVAHEVASLPTTELIAPIRRAFLPGYAKMASQPELLRTSFLNVYPILLFIALPVSVGIALLADLFVLVALGEKWVDSIPLIRILALYGFITVLSSITGPMYISLGRPQILTRILAVGALVLVPSVFWAAKLAGAYGVAWAVTGSAAFLFTIDLLTVSRLLHVNIFSILLATWRTATAALCMAAVVWGLQSQFVPSELFVERFLLLLIYAATGAVAYFAVHLVIWRISGLPDGPERHFVNEFQKQVSKLRLHRAV